MKKKRNKTPSHGRAKEAGVPAHVSAAPGLREVDSSADGSPVGPASGLAKLAAVLFGLALIIAIYLGWQSATGHAIMGCGAEGGCAKILKSKWGKVLGVPVSLPGAGVYAFLLWAAMRRVAVSLRQRRWECGASILVLGGALWFVILQAFVLKAFCPWCDSAHALASVGVIVLWRARHQAPAIAVPGRIGLAAILVPAAAVAGMAVFQSVSPEPERIQEGRLSQAMLAGAGTLSLHGGRITVVPSALPRIGLPDAGIVLVTLTDFTCPHCRELHRTLTQLAAQHPGKFHAVLLPGAYEPDARELHRIMLTLWRVDPERYATLAAGLVDGTINPAPRDVLDKIQSQLNGRFYELAWAHSVWVQDTVRLADELLAINSREAHASTLPQVMIRDRVFTGVPHAATVLRWIEGKSDAEAGVPVVAAAPTPPTVPTAGAQATISFDSTTIDLGTVTKGEAVTKTITFTNSGKAPLTLKSVKAGCGCTTVNGWEQTVPPGKQGSFQVKLDTEKFNGAVTKTVDVESNASNANVRISLNANIWSPVALSASMASFGSVLKGTKVEPLNVDITVTEQEPVNVTGVTSSNPYFKTELKAIEEGRRYQMTVSVPKLGDSTQNADLVLALGHPKIKQLKVPAYINPTDLLVVQPTQLNISYADLRSKTNALITVVSNDPALARLEVTDMAYSGGTDAGMTFERFGDDRSGRITFTLPSGHMPPAANDALLSFRTNDPAHAEVKIPIRFFGARPQPEVPSGSPPQ